LKKSRWHPLRIIALPVIFSVVVTAAFGVWYVKRLEQTVTAKFEGRKWQFPSKIYSDSYLLYVGMNLRATT